MTSTLADYAGRTYDVLAFQGAQAGGDTLLAQDLLEGGGAICTGIQKLAQRFVLELLTEVGSMRFLPRRGTGFMASLGRGELRTDADVYTAFAFATADIARNLAGDAAPGDPDDERYASATLLGVEIRPGYAWLRIRITSRAGDSRPVILPIRTTP